MIPANNIFPINPEISISTLKLYGEVLEMFKSNDYETYFLGLGLLKEEFSEDILKVKVSYQYYENPSGPFISTRDTIRNLIDIGLKYNIRELNDHFKIYNFISIIYSLKGALSAILLQWKFNKLVQENGESPRTGPCC